MKINKKGISLIVVVVSIIILALLATILIVSILKTKYFGGNKSDGEYKGITITKDTEGVIFTKADGMTPGDADNIESGDIVLYGDYEYRYNSYRDYSEWVIDPDINGWCVYLSPEYLEKKLVGELCGSIYGKQLVIMEGTFLGADIVASPKIPSSVTNMNVTFSECSSLRKAPEIPEGVRNMYGTFLGCSSLVDPPEIPFGVTNMYGTFGKCVNLIKAPVIPSSVTTMGGTFAGCISLKKAPIIPENVTDMQATFNGCISLAEAPVIPSTVTNMELTFCDCTELTGVVEINSLSVSKVINCLQNLTNPLIIKVPSGSTTHKKFMEEYNTYKNITIQIVEVE